MVELSAVCLALAMFFEAGIEPPSVQAWTGWSVINAGMTMHRKPWGVCRQVRYGGPYYGITDNDVFGDGYTIENRPHGKRWAQTLAVAKGILNGSIPDPTGGANHFECDDPRRCAVPPRWSIGMEFRGKAGHQFFWKEARKVQARVLIKGGG